MAENKIKEKLQRKVSNVEIDPKSAVMNSVIPEQLWNSLSNWFT